MKQSNTVLKWAIALFSLLLTFLIWQKGLQESFDRPSVAPRISLIQSEMAVSASSSVPEEIKNVFFGPDPQDKLYKALKSIPFEQMEDRQRLLMALLESSENEQRIILNKDFKDKNFQLVKTSLLDKKNGEEIEKIFKFKEIELDPFLYQITCSQLTSSRKICVNKSYNSLTAFRLLLSQALPFLASIVGVVLLVKESFNLIRKKNIAWPKNISPPLSIIDMILLIAGGFVVVGEVAFPAIVVPIIDLLFNNVSPPLKESLRVLFGYASMTLVPLLIIRYQLGGIVSTKIEGGWLQWKIKPIREAIFKSISGWLMIMPVVLLVGWITNEVFGDQGGSNPLLDLVLSSDELIPLLLLLITTVIFAPVFEELVFRGVLLPVLVSKIGKIGGVLTSALIFSLAHLSVGELPPLFVLGIGLGLMRLTSGRLFPCALMHSLWNGVTFASLLLVA